MVRIITDSTSDIPIARGKECGIDIMPLTVHFGNEAFKDGIELTNEEFYIRLAKANELPTTSQINIDEFTAIFKKYTDAGDDIVGIFISSNMSGTYQSAAIAAADIAPDRIHVIDSRTVTFALGLLVEEAIRMRDRGLSAAEIAENIRALTQRVQLFAVVDTLKYLRMGGRLSAASAIFGELLNIHPVITIKNGEVFAIGKGRGMRSAFRILREKYLELPADDGYYFSYGNSNAHDMQKRCKDEFSTIAGDSDILESDIGAVVGTHVGAGAAGIAYISK